MENRFEPNPEHDGWGDYLKPPSPFGQEHNELDAASTRRVQPQGLCARVQEMLPHLLENDGTIRPEMAASVYGHLALCPGCAREFDRQKQVISLVESLPPAEMPMDFSQIIMQRIQTEIGPIYGAAPFPAHASSLKAAQEAVVAQTTSVQTVQTTSLNSQNYTQLTLWQRLSAASVLSAMLAFFLSTSWGRQMLGVNLQTAVQWIEQIGETLQRVPGLAWVATLVGVTLAQMSDALKETYQAMGANAVYALAIEAGCGVALVTLMAARRNRAQAQV